MQRFEFSAQVTPQEQGKLIDFLAVKTSVSRVKLKEAMIKGAVWRSKAGKTLRVRRATTEIVAGERIKLYYDETLLALEPPTVTCIADEQKYSLWYKPAGLLTQGSEYGDHYSLERIVAQRSEQRPVFLVHRLDREAEGLVMLAHNKIAAAHFSNLLVTHAIEKRYRVMVLGDIAAQGERGMLEMPLDGKSARTDYAVVDYCTETRRTRLDVWPRTGRFHQIRRHFAAVGHPVIGDPRYGCGNKEVSGLKLAAVGLQFTCPFTHRQRQFDVTGHLNW